MTLWVARAGRYGEHELFDLENDVVAVGWEQVPNLSDIQDRDQLRQLLLSIYTDRKPQTAENWANQLWKFVRVFQVGDLVALPMKTQAAVAFGKISGEYQYDLDAPAGVKHQRPVEWIIKDFPRREIDPDLRSSLGGASTIFSIKRHNAEERIKSLLKGERSIAAAGSQADGGEEDEEAEILDLQAQAEDQIIDFISRKFVGHELTYLVAGVLEAQGYSTRVSPPGPDGGVDIVAGRGAMGFESPRLCVQVKSGDVQVDVKVLRELQGVMKKYQAEHGLIVSWSGFKSTMKKEAQQSFFEIRLWDQPDLVRTIQEVYEHLPSQLRAELPLNRTWILVIEED